MSGYDEATFDFIDSTRAPYSLSREDYSFPDNPPKIIELSLRRRSDRVLERLQPFDGLVELDATDESDLSSRGLSLLSQAKDLRKLNFVDCSPKHLPPEAFATLPSIPSLDSIMFLYRGNGDEALKHIARVKTLKTLSLGGAFTDVGLAHLRKCSRLRDVNLTKTRVTDVGMRHLSHLRSLRKLNIEGLPIHRKGLTEIAKLGKLEGLYVSGKHLSDRDIRPLYGLDNLRSLSLDKTLITRKTVEWLATLPKLEELFLQGTRLANDDIAALFGRPRLRTVYLDSTRVTKARGRELLGSLRPKIARVWCRGCIFAVGKSGRVIDVTKDFDDLPVRD